jgi:hypothetical protein
MKKIIFILVSVSLLAALFAEEKLNIFQSNQSRISVMVSDIDSLIFGTNNTLLHIYKSDQTVLSFPTSEIDSLNFEGTENIVTLEYLGNSVNINNPFAGKGVDITANGASVEINATIADNEIKYLVSGTSTDGLLKIYSICKFELLLNNLALTNTSGAPINIQSKKRAAITLVGGTTNSLEDGNVYTLTTEDQKSTIFSEGQLVFGGTGHLNVKSNSKHAICSDDYIVVNNGNITVSGAAKDGIHTNGYFKSTGGTIHITATGDGIDCELGHVIIEGGNITTNNSVADTKGISCDSTMIISGGNITAIVSGNQAKALRSKQSIQINGGTIIINTSGAVVLEASGLGYDPSYCTAIKAGTDIDIAGSSITINSTGTAGKGISADGNITMTAGTLNVSVSGTGTTYKNSLNITDAYNSTCVTADGNISIIDGTVTLTTKNTASGGKGFSANGTITFGSVTNSPTINATTAGARFLVSGTDYSHPKTVVADKAITIHNGTNAFTSTDDGIHSDTSITINGGHTTVTAISTTQGVGEGVEAPLIYFNGGVTNITASNDGVNATFGTKAGGIESNDGSHFYITGGTHYINATNGDAIDSNGNITMSGGVVFANGPSSGVEEAVDFNGIFNMNGGTFVGAGSNSNMTKAMSTSSTQPNLYISSSSLISSATMITVTIGGTSAVSFKPKYGGYKYLISTPNMTKGSAYVVYTGGSYSGGTSTNGLNWGGTFSSLGAVSKKTGNLSASTTVNSISF